jgi:translin
VSESAGAGVDRPAFRAALRDAIAEIDLQLRGAHEAREQALPACRRVIRASGSSIRAVHRLETASALALADDAEAALREAQDALEGFPSVAHAGFLHDAEKEYAEARFTMALVSRAPLPTRAELGVAPASWLKGLAEAASELRRHTLDLMRGGDLDAAETLLGAMDDAYDALMVIDYPDAITAGLRRTVDALRAVLERTRGDVTATAVQARLQRAIEQA